MRMNWMIHTANVCLAIAAASVITGCEWDRRGHNDAYGPTRAHQQSQQLPHQGAGGAYEQRAPSPSVGTDDGGDIEQTDPSMPRSPN
ncbi:MAG: hypothetical protein ACODAD_05970 [Planctomycetota bacterium]